MSRLTVQTAATAPEAARPMLEKVQAANGFLPNLVGVLANAPEALETYLSVGQINGRGALDAAAREVVQITAARIHGCDFCLAGHTRIAVRVARMAPAQVQALQQGQDTGDARLDAVRRFTEAVIASRGAVADAALADFLDAGLSQREALDVVLGISLATLSNFANNLARTEVNPQLQDYLPAHFQPGAAA